MKLGCVLLILCTIAGLLSGCETIQAIDRGLSSVTETMTERDRITGERALSFANRTEQIQKGNQWAEKFVADAKASGKKLNAECNPIAYERIKRIFNRLHQVSHVREEQWTPVLIEEKEWNAFTTGGTYFVINSGLEADLKDDAELANVIAHEMAHTVANHVFESQSHMQLNALAGSKSARRESFQAAFTHENEAEADRVAVLYCALAGYDPYAGARIWERMHQKAGDDALFVHDHPMNSERAEQAQRVASQSVKYYVPDELNPDFLAILQKNEVFEQKKEASLEAGKGGGVLSALDATLNAMNQKQQAKLEEQRQQMQIQFIQSVNQVSAIVSSAAVTQTRWRVTVRYNGNRRLTDLGFKLIVKRNNADPLQIAQQIPGVLNPNSTFYVDFESPELNAYGTLAQNVLFMYDNARGL